MATKNEQFFIDLGKGASWAAGVAFQRSNPLPLDKYSVFETEAKAIEYATTNAVAYPGQVVAYVDGDKMAVCVLAQNADGSALELQAIGGAIGDFETAAADTLPQKKAIYGEDGETVVGYEVKWVPISAIVEGDGDTTYTFGFKETEVDGVKVIDEKILVITSENKGVKGETKEIALDFLTPEEVAALIEAETNRATGAEEALGKRIDDLSDVVEAIDFVDEDELATALEPYAKTADVNKTLEDYAKTSEVESALGAYTTTEGLNTLLAGKVGTDTYATDKEALEGAIEAAQKTADDVTTAFNTFMESEDIDDTINTLKEIQAELDKMADATSVTESLAKKADKVEGAVSGNFAGLDANGNLIDSGKKAADFEVAGAAAAVEAKLADYATTATLTTELGKKADTTALEGAVSTLEGAISAAEGRAAADATSKANQAEANAIADAEGKLGAYKTEVSGALDLKANAADVYAKSEVYTKSETDSAITEAVKGATGGTDASSVLADLNAFKKAVKTEVWGSEVADDATTTTSSRIDDLATELAGVKTTAEAAQTAGQVEAAIAAKGYEALIAEAKKAGTDAGAQASTNAANILALQSAVGENGLAGRIATLEAYDAAHEPLFNALSGKVDGLETTVAGKADASTVETLSGTVGTISGKVDGHGTSIAALETAVADRYTKSEADALLANKADKSSVYTKDEIDGKTGDLGGKTVIALIEEAKNAAIAGATYNDAEVRGLIAANAGLIADNTSAISTEAGRAAAEEQRLAGLIADNTTAIAGNTAAINSILGNEDEVDYNSIAELAAWITEHGKEAEGMVEAIEANAAAIEVNAGDIKTINETTIPAAIASANSYTDGAIAALGMANYKVKDVDGTSLEVSETGVASVKAVSTDLLTQGSDELVLFGGDAGKKVSE